MWWLLVLYTGVAGLLNNPGVTDLDLERRVQTVMEEMLHLQRDVSDVLLSNADLKQMISELKQNNADLKQSYADLKQINTDLKHDVDTLKFKDQNIAFYAYLTNDMVNPSQGQTMAFSGVETNVGNAYDPLHGTFVAPISGTYHFSILASCHPSSSHSLHLVLKKSSVAKNQMFLFLDSNTSYWLQRGVSSVLHLNQGERVWMEVWLAQGSNTIAGYRSDDDASHTHFSGFLIHAD